MYVIDEIFINSIKALIQGSGESKKKGAADLEQNS
jgi:hypothetical protein